MSAVQKDAQLAFLASNVGYQEGQNNTNKFTVWQTDGKWSAAEWCVDTETEILTRVGWKSWTEVETGDFTLGLDMDTGLARWTEILGVHRLPAEERQVLRMEGKTHSSLSTVDHKWPIERRTRSGWDRRFIRNGSGIIRGHRDGMGWKSTDAIITATLCSELPDEQKYVDDMVELAGWFWTEGGIRQASTTIDQSHVVNPDKVARIAKCLYGLYGAPVDRLPSQPSVEPQWAQHRFGKNTSFCLNRAASAPLLEACPDRVPSVEFLLQLTEAQLLLFIEVSIAGDGNVSGNRRYIAQRRREPLDRMQMACALAGIPTHLWVNPHDVKDDANRHGEAPWRLQLLRRNRVTPVGAVGQRGSGNRFSMNWETYDGSVWCPTTTTGTWLARRHGTVFYTGNCDSSAQQAAVEAGGFRWLPTSQWGYKGSSYCPWTVADAKTLGIWQPRTAAPQSGWQVLFDWNHNGVADHIETVYRVNSNGTFITIGGNVNNAVQYVLRDFTYVLGFVAFPFATTPSPGGSVLPDYNPPVHLIGNIVSSYVPDGYAGGYLFTDAGYVYGFGHYPGHFGNPATDPNTNWVAGHRVGARIVAPTVLGAHYCCVDTFGETYNY